MAPFLEIYDHLAKEWNLDNRKTRRILRRYTKQFEVERELLKTKELKLPPYFKDRRTDIEYIYDILNGWTMEDIICDVWLSEWLSHHDPNITIDHSGADKERNVEKYAASRVTTDPDFVFTSYGRKVELELQMSRKERTTFDMKINKVDRVARARGKFLWVIVPTGQFFICDPRKDLKGLPPFENPAWGGKKVYRLDMDRVKKIGLHDIANGFSEALIEKIYS